MRGRRPGYARGRRIHGRRLATRAERVLVDLCRRRHLALRWSLFGRLTHRELLRRALALCRLRWRSVDDRHACCSLGLRPRLRRRVDLFGASHRRLPHLHFHRCCIVIVVLRGSLLFVSRPLKIDGRPQHTLRRERNLHALCVAAGSLLIRGRQQLPLRFPQRVDDHLGGGDTLRNSHIGSFDKFFGYMYLFSFLLRFTVYISTAVVLLLYNYTYTTDSGTCSVLGDWVVAQHGPVSVLHSVLWHDNT